jgi:hypothetical protein
MTTPAREFPGHIQAGGEASGAPWAEATFLTVDDEVAILVNQTEVARVASPTVTDTGTNDVFLIEGADEPLFFRPRDPEAFRAAVLPPQTTAEKIAAATAVTAAADDATLVMDTVPGSEPGAEADAEAAAEDEPSTPAWVWWVLGGLALLILVLLLAFCGDDGETGTSSTTTTTLAGSTTSVPATTTTAPATTTTAPATTTTAAPTTTTTAAATTTTVAPTTTSSLPEPAFGSGTQIVGEDVQPGVYETGIVTGLVGCEWERLSGTSGAPEEVIAGGEVANHDVVEVMADDAAFDTNCEAWYELTEMDPLLTEIPEGKWVLGTHISPGAYAAPGGVDCTWSRLSGLSGTPEDVIAGDEPSGAATVDIDPADVAFSSTGCGSWAPET